MKVYATVQSLFPTGLGDVPDDVNTDPVDILWYSGDSAVAAASAVAQILTEATESDNPTYNYLTAIRVEMEHQ